MQRKSVCGGSAVEKCGGESGWGMWVGNVGGVGGLGDAQAVEHCRENQVGHDE